MGSSVEASVSDWAAEDGDAKAGSVAFTTGGEVVSSDSESLEELGTRRLHSSGAEEIDEST